MNEKEKILTIRIRNLCKSEGVKRLRICEIIEYVMERYGISPISGLPLICTGFNCIDGETCKRCWNKEFNKLQEGGDPVL